jgi:hypothetical protein
MDISAFQLLKHNTRTNQNSRLHDTPIISYGRVIQVIDIQTVVVETVIQTSLSKEVYTVTLLSLSSALLELSDYPKLGDTVLLLFLQRHDPLMFIKSAINSAEATGYNAFSGVGVLMSAARRAASTVIAAYEENGKPIMEMTSDAELYGTFNNLATLTFCRMLFDREDEALITILFGNGRPFIEQHLARTERRHGFWKDPDGEWEEMDASVTEQYSPYAPIKKDIQGAQTTDIGLGTDKDDAPVETDAPLVQTVHGKAPITRDIRSPQSLKIGIGNAESDDAEEQRDAPITAELGEKADITLTSKSALTIHFAKAMLTETEDSYDLVVTGAITLTSDDLITVKAGGNIEISADGDVKVAAGGNAEVKAAGDAKVEATGNMDVKGANVTLDASALCTLKTGDAISWMPNIMPACPLGPVHGGVAAGIVKLKGA